MCKAYIFVPNIMCTHIYIYIYIYRAGSMGGQIGQLPGANKLFEKMLFTIYI